MSGNRKVVRLRGDGGRARAAAQSAGARSAAAESAGFDAPPSEVEIDELGARMRTAPLTMADLELLDRFRRERYAATVEAAVRVGAATGQPVQARAGKTTEAIVASLRRDPRMRLSQMPDMAACRVVVPDLVDQDRAVGAISAVMPVTAVEDRRILSQHGYRAVHLVGEVDGGPVEVQVRTALQQRWASVADKLALDFGRAFKEGQGPPEIQARLQHLSQLGARVEQASRIARETGVRSARGWSRAMEDSLNQQLRQLLAEARAQRRRALGQA